MQQNGKEEEKEKKGRRRIWPNSEPAQSCSLLFMCKRFFPTIYSPVVWCHEYSTPLYVPHLNFSLLYFHLVSAHICARQLQTETIILGKRNGGWCGRSERYIYSSCVEMMESSSHSAKLSHMAQDTSDNLPRVGNGTTVIHFYHQIKSYSDSHSLISSVNLLFCILR